MKSFILILSLLFMVKTQDTTAQRYSIKPFIEYLQDQGYYKILEDIKMNFGTDVAVDMCKSLIPSPHCNEVVRNYVKTPAVICSRGYSSNGSNENIIAFLDRRKYLSTLGKIKNYKPILQQINLRYRNS